MEEKELSEGSARVISGTGDIVGFGVGGSDSGCHRLEKAVEERLEGWWCIVKFVERKLCRKKVEKSI